MGHSKTEGVWGLKATLTPREGGGGGASLSFLCPLAKLGKHVAHRYGINE